MTAITRKLIKDDRGNTLVLSAGPNHAHVWYNRSERSWVAQYMDVNGFQIWGHGSDYVYTKEEAVNLAEHYLTGNEV